MALVLVIILAAAVAWVVLDRTGKEPKAKVNEARVAATRTVQQLGASSGELLDKLRGRFDRSADHEAFKGWAAALVEGVPGAGEGAGAFRAWLDALAPAELREFRSRLAAFCATLDIEEGWLHNGQLGSKPELRRSLEETVGLYALAYARGAGQRGDITRTRAFQRWMAAPNRLDNRGFGTKLYAALVARGLVTPPPELLLAPERQRRAYATQAIREAAARDPEAFDAILAEVLAPAPKALAAPAPEPAPPAAEPAPEPAVVIPAEPAEPVNSSGRRNRSHVEA